MSAWQDDPAHFARHFAAQGGDARGFAERRLFGAYLRAMLGEAVDAGQVQIADATAVGATRDSHGWRVALDSGEAVSARALALAVGNQEPEPIRVLAEAGERYVNNPWGSDARAAVRALVEGNGSALLVGTGLTMVDLALSLDAAGHRGRIVALSRRGLVPRAHADFDPAPVDRDQVPSGDLRGLWRWLRRRSAEVGWRAAIDSLRPHSQALWQALDDPQQRRFMRHGRPWWDVHRHRIAPEVAATIHRLIADGQLEIVAGRIVAATPAEAGVDVTIRRRGAERGSTVHVDYVFNCTGPLHAIERTRDRLLGGLLERGDVRPDRLGIGLAVDGRSRAGSRLWALGPLTKGRYWEIIAVPDIRAQAAAVAEDIARELEE